MNNQTIPADERDIQRRRSLVLLLEHAKSYVKRARQSCPDEGSESAAEIAALSEAIGILEAEQ
jgi:hypothetical protein